jgi:hypothetical protein
MVTIALSASYQSLGPGFEDYLKWILTEMFVGIAFAPSDETGTMNFFLFRIVRTPGLFDLGEHQVQLCFKLFSLLFFHRSLIPELPQLLD